MKITPKYFFSIVNIVKKDFVNIPSNIKLVVLAFFIYTLAWGVLEPLQALYFGSFTSNYLGVGIIFALFNIVLLLLALPVGALSDRVKATKLMSIGLLLYPAIGAFYYTATSIVNLSVTRLLNGFGATLVWISGESYIRKESPKNKGAETFGLYSTAVNFAIVIGALCGAFLVLFFSIKELFLLLFPIPVIAAIIVLRINPLQKKEKTVISGMEDVIEKDALGAKEVNDFFKAGIASFYCLIMTFFGGFYYYLLLVFIPLTAKHINMGISEILLLYALVHIPFLLGFLFSEISDRIGKARMIMLGLLIASVSLGLVFFSAESLPLFITLCFFFGLSLSITGPAINGLITDLTPKNESGSVTGLVNAAYYAGGAIGPLTFGALADAFGLIPSFVAVAALAIMLAILTIALKGFLTPKEQNK